MLISLLYSVNSKIIPIKLANSALRILLLILGKLSGKEIDFSVLDMEPILTKPSMIRQKKSIVMWRNQDSYWPTVCVSLTLCDRNFH